MCLSKLRITTDDFPDDDAIQTFLNLMCQYNWEKVELERCGVIEGEFRRYVQRMRLELFLAGIDVEDR